VILLLGKIYNYTAWQINLPSFLDSQCGRRGIDLNDIWGDCGRPHCLLVKLQIVGAIHIDMLCPKCKKYFKFSAAFSVHLTRKKPCVALWLSSQELRMLIEGKAAAFKKEMDEFEERMAILREQLEAEEAEEAEEAKAAETAKAAEKAEKSEKSETLVLLSPNKYHSGKIYVIESDEGRVCYIGSTCKSLIERMRQHKSNMKRWNAGKANFTTSFDVLKYSDARISLVEDFACETNHQLRKRESFHISVARRDFADNSENDKCVNKLLTG
jgi:Zn-finger nucleic acid-binding protein